jgi:hypothetical protein
MHAVHHRTFYGLPRRLRTSFFIFLLAAVAFPVFSQNLVVNGNFSEGMNGWDSLLVNSPAQATKTVTDGVCGISITAAGTETWHVQLKQKGIRLDSSTSYYFSFEAYAASEREIEASVGMENGPYTLYTPANKVRYQLSTEKQSFSTYFTMTSPGDSNARVQFNCGLAAVDVYITKVSIEKVSTPVLMLLSPKGGEAWSCNSSQEIEWVGAGLENVTLSYSIDAGLTWTAIATNPAGSGRFVWTIPVKSSPWCLVRVLDAAGSGLGDTSAQPFEIGDYFNMIANGSFNDSTTFPWNPLGVYGSASGTATVSDGVCAITVTTAGTESWNVQFTQAGIMLCEGETYVLSFYAWADSPRALYANIGQAGGAYESYLGDTTKGLITLSTEKQAYRIEFTMSKPADTNARLDFNTGLSAGTVFLDNISLYRKRVLGVRRISGGGGTGNCSKLLVVVKTGPRTVVRSIPLRGPAVRARILDLKGRLLKTVRVDRGTALWDCRSEAGAAVAPGAYFMQIITASGSVVVPVLAPVR